MLIINKSYYSVKRYFDNTYHSFRKVFGNIIPSTINKLVFRDALSPVSSEDRIVSRSINNLYDRNQKFLGFCPISKQQYNARLADRVKPFSKVQRDKIKFEAITLQTVDFETNVRKATLSRARSLVKEHLKLGNKILRPVNLSVASKSLNLQASAGFYWFTKKSNVLSEVINSTEYFVKNFDFKLLMSFPTYISYRVQQRPSSVKLRLIYVYSGIITLIEQKFLTPLLKHFLGNSTPYVVGNVGSDLVNRYGCWQQNKFIVSLDWKSFDWTANCLLIQVAFGIIKESFHMTFLENNLFDFISTYFIRTPIVTVDSQGETTVVSKIRGIPSGSSFTNLIGTIVNMLVVYCFMIDNNIPIDPDCLAFLGDDVIISTNSRKFTITSFSTYSKTNFDMDLSVEKSSIYKPGEKVYFLGGLIDSNGRYANYELLLYQISTTTSDLFIKCSTSEDHIHRLWDKICSICFKYSDGYILFDYVWPEIEKYLGTSYYSSEYKEIFFRATAPGLETKEVGKIKNFKLMRQLGWFIQ